MEAQALTIRVGHSDEESEDEILTSHTHLDVETMSSAPHPALPQGCQNVYSPCMTTSIYGQASLSSVSTSSSVESHGIYHCLSDQSDFGAANFEPYMASDSPSEDCRPLVYVSPGGLLTVLLKHGLSVEMTLDQTIRVVNSRHSSAAAINSRGSSSAVFHSGAKIFQTGTTTEAELFWERKARMTTEAFAFANGPLCYEKQLGSLASPVATPAKFRDLSQDMTVTLLFSASQYGPQLMDQFEELAGLAKFNDMGAGGYAVNVNSVAVRQYPNGDITVTSGPKFISMSPTTGVIKLKTHFVDIAVEDWYVQVQRSGHKLLATVDELLLSNGSLDVGFGRDRCLFSRIPGHEKRHPSPVLYEPSCLSHFRRHCHAILPWHHQNRCFNSKRHARHGHVRYSKGLYSPDFVDAADTRDWY